MNTLIKIVILVIVFISFDCKHQDEFHVDQELLIATDTIPLKLINNTKWQANKATQIGMHKIDSTVKKFKELKRRDFKNLGALLSKETSTIVKNCDMSGEAHDQLHLVLVPILDQVVLLKEDHELVAKNTALKNIENLIEAYYQFFND